MNKGVLQSSPVQQMMAAGNPSWWNINNLMRPPYVVPSSSSSSISSPNSSSTSSFMAPTPNYHANNGDDALQAQYNNMNAIMSSANYNSSSSSSWIDDQQQLPESWSQHLFSGMFNMGEEAKKMGSWEEQVMLAHQHQQQQTGLIDQVKQENSVDSYNNNSNNQESQLVPPPKAWSHHQSYPQMNIIPTSSPQSCVTTFSSNNNSAATTTTNNNNNNSMLDFSSKSSDNNFHGRQSERSSECNSTATGGALKKAKVQASSSQTTFKVRKEKLGDRITALHQLVSPFGKTDTASVLLEAIGYIRFLQSQIQALSLPYLNSGAGNKRQPHPVQGERNCIFPEDPGQLLNENCLKRKGGPDQESYEETKDLKSRGLCLVPVSCTLHVGSDNGADYWAPAFGGGFR